VSFGEEPLIRKAFLVQPHRPASVSLRIPMCVVRLRLIPVLCVVATAPLGAQDAAEQSSAEGWWARGVGSVFVFAGSMAYRPNPQLPGLEGKTIQGFGAGFFPGDPFLHHTVGIDLHAWSVDRSYSSIVPGAAEHRTELKARAFAIGTRVGLPPGWPVGAAILGGLSYIDHAMEVAGRPAWFLPGVEQTWSAEDGGWSPYWGLSVDGRIGAVSVGFEKRWIRTSATFDDPFVLRDVPLGGSSVLLTLAWYQGR